MKKTKLVLGIMLIMLLALSTGLMATTIYVNSSTGNDGNNGTSGSPYKTFHKGYTEAGSGHTIDLTGTFDWTNGDETGDASTTGYTLSKSLSIIGQGVDVTIIQAASSAGVADRCVFTISAGFTVTFEDLTFQWGNVASGSYNAAGITAISGATINMSRCKMIENSIGGTGWGVAGAIASTSWNRVTHTFNSCTFKDNTASGSGYVAGAIELHEGKAAVFENCTFDGNQGLCNKAYSGYALAAGAVFEFYRASAATSPYHKYTNCTFYNNSADAGAGAIYTVTGGSDRDYITNCTFANNSVSVGGSGGIAGGDPYGSYVVRIYIENTIMANNTNESSSGDDIDGTKLTIYDNGSNIVEFPVNGASFSETSITGNQANLWGTGVSATPSLADNNTINGTQTLKLITGSVAINAGSSTANGSVSIPSTDQRGAERNGAVDIGAYEYWDDDGSLPVELTSFTADNTRAGEITLNWVTESEIENLGFILERRAESEDGSTAEWTEIASYITDEALRGQGSVTYRTEYTFTDKIVESGQSYDYRLADVSYAGEKVYHALNVLGVAVAVIPEEFALFPAYPNPFNPATTISYHLIEDGNVTITIFNINGRKVTRLVDKAQNAGKYKLYWDASGVSVGVYFCKLTQGNHTATQKLIFLK